MNLHLRRRTLVLASSAALVLSVAGTVAASSAKPAAPGLDRGRVDMTVDSTGVVTCTLDTATGPDAASMTFTAAPTAAPFACVLTMPANSEFQVTPETAGSPVNLVRVLASPTDLVFSFPSAGQHGVYHFLVIPPSFP